MTSGKSRSHRFFLYLDPANPPKVKDISFHWQHLAAEELSAGQWGEILRPLIVINAGMDKIDRDMFAAAVKHPKTGIPTHTRAHSALYKASNPSDILAGMQFFARHDENVESSFFEISHLKLRRYLPYLPAKDLASSLFPFARSHYLPYDDFWEDFQEAWSNQFKIADDNHIGQVYERAAKLALPLKKEMIVLFDGYLRDRADLMTADKRDKLLWTAAMIDNIHGGTILADTVPELIANRDMNNATMRNTVCAWFSLFSIPPLKDGGGNSSSKSEIRLREIFGRTATIRSEKDHVLPYVASPVDMRLDFKAHDVIVEMDGKTHFNFDFNGERRYNGQTLINSAVKAKMAKKSRLLHIDNNSYSYLFYRCSLSEQDRIARQICEEAIEKGAGNYRVFINENQILFDSMQNNSFIPG